MASSSLPQSLQTAEALHGGVQRTQPCPRQFQADLPAHQGGTDGAFALVADAAPGTLVLSCVSGNTETIARAGLGLKPLRLYRAGVVLVLYPPPTSTPCLISHATISAFFQPLSRVFHHCRYRHGPLHLLYEVIVA